MTARHGSVRQGERGTAEQRNNSQRKKVLDDTNQREKMGEVLFWSGSGRGRVQGKGEDRIGWLQAE
jgi:hypothetical protein